MDLCHIDKNLSVYSVKFGQFAVCTVNIASNFGLLTNLMINVISLNNHQ